MIQTQSIKKVLKCTTALKDRKLEPCNLITVVSVPSDIVAYVSFDTNSEDSKKFLLKNNSELNLMEGLKPYSKGSDIFITTEGTSNEDLILNLSTIKDDKALNVIVKQSADKVGLDSTVSNAMLQLDGMADFLSNFDKTIDKYDYNSILSQGTSNSTTLTTILNKVLDCDKIEINLGIYNPALLGAYNSSARGIIAMLDGVPIASETGYTGDMISTNNHRIKENIRGKTLTIISNVAHTATTTYYDLTESTLKA